MTVCLVFVIVLLLAVAVWFLLGPAGGSTLNLGVPCGSVLHPAPARRGLVTDCHSALADNRRSALRCAALAGPLAVVLIVVRRLRSTP